MRAASPSLSDAPLVSMRDGVLGWLCPALVICRPGLGGAHMGSQEPPLQASHQLGLACLAISPRLRGQAGSLSPSAACLESGPPAEHIDRGPFTPQHG